MGCPLLQAAEKSQFDREREAKEASRRANIQAEVRAALAKSEEEETTQESVLMNPKDVKPYAYPQAKRTKEELLAKSKRDRLTHEEQELLDLLMLGELIPDLQKEVCSYLTGWHEIGQFKDKGRETPVTAITTYYDQWHKEQEYAVLKEKLVSGGQDGSIKIWDVKTQICQYTMPGNEPVTALAMHSSRNKDNGFFPTMIAAAYGTTIKLFDITGQTPTLAKALTGSPSKIVYLHEHWDDSTKLYKLESSGLTDDIIRIWDVPTEKYEQSIVHRNTIPYYINESGIFTWNAATHAPQCASLPAHIPTALSPEVVIIKFNKESQKLEKGLFASGDANGTIYIWDTSNPSCVATLHGHTAQNNWLVHKKSTPLHQ